MGTSVLSWGRCDFCSYLAPCPKAGPLLGPGVRSHTSPARGHAATAGCSFISLDQGSARESTGFGLCGIKLKTQVTYTCHVYNMFVIKAAALNIVGNRCCDSE